MEKEEKMIKNEFAEFDDYVHTQYKNMILFVSENEECVNCVCTALISITMLATFGVIF